MHELVLLVARLNLFVILYYAAEPGDAEVSNVTIPRKGRLLAIEFS